MVSIDMQTCFALTGTGAAVGAGLMQLVRSDQPQVRASIRRYQLGLWMLSGMMVQTLVPQAWQPLALKLAIVLAATGVACLGWAFHELNGTRTRPFVGVAAVAVVALIMAAGLQGSARGFELVLCTTFCLAGAVITMDQAMLISRAPSRPRISELMLMTLAGLFTVNWMITLEHAWTTSEPVPEHWVQAPLWLRPWSGLSFAVLPITVAAVALTIINDRLMQTLRNRALSDELTGALSRRGLRELGEQLLAMQASHPNLVAVLMLDVDHFKSINDRYGHLVGDEVLKHLTAVVKGNLRSDALLARYGGEEFSVLLPLRDVDEAVVVAERVRHAVETSPCPSRAGPVPMTVSVGVAFHRSAGTLDEALGRADQCLYAAKQNGRNRVVAGPV